MKKNLFSLSATMVTTVWLKQPTCFCSGASKDKDKNPQLLEYI